MPTTSITLNLASIRTSVVAIARHVDAETTLRTVRVQGRFRADNGEALREAAIAGLGVCLLPTWLTASDISRGALVQVLSHYDIPEGGLYVLRPPGPSAPSKVRALIDFLAARFGPAPYWDAGITAQCKVR